MPMYFFSVSRDGKPASMGDGLELADDKAAWEEATTACGELLRDLDGSLRPGGSWKMQVSRGGGDTIYVLSFDSEAL